MLCAHGSYGDHGRVGCIRGACRDRPTALLPRVRNNHRRRPDCFDIPMASHRKGKRLRPGTTLENNDRQRSPLRHTPRLATEHGAMHLPAGGPTGQDRARIPPRTHRAQGKHRPPTRPSSTFPELKESGRVGVGPIHGRAEKGWDPAVGQGGVPLCPGAGGQGLPSVPRQRQEVPSACRPSQARSSMFSRCAPTIRWAGSGRTQIGMLQTWRRTTPSPRGEPANSSNA
jgi:hypothetical protein